MGLFECEMLEQRGYVFPEYYCKYSMARIPIMFNELSGYFDTTVQVSVSAPKRTVENKRIVASYGFIYTSVDLIGVFFI